MVVAVQSAVVANFLWWSTGKICATQSSVAVVAVQSAMVGNLLSDCRVTLFTLSMLWR